MIRYVELKTGHSDDGPAWVARVKLSRSGRTVYFNRKALKRGRGVSGNHVDVETAEVYWVSGVKKDGLDRHRFGSGIVLIEAGAVGEYLQLVGAAELDRSRFRVIPDLPDTDPASFGAVEHRRLHE